MGAWTDEDNRRVTDEFLLSIAQYLGIPEAQATSKGAILQALTGPRPDEEEIRGEFSPIIQSFQKQAQGYSAAEKEAMGSQTRQQLAEQARASGGQQRMLQGRSKAMAATINQSTQAAKQAEAVQGVSAANKAYMEEGKEGLANTEQQIAMASQNRLDAYNKRRADVMLNMEQLMELRRQSKEQQNT